MIKKVLICFLAFFSIKTAVFSQVSDWGNVSLNELKMVRSDIDTTAISSIFIALTFLIACFESNKSKNNENNSQAKDTYYEVVISDSDFCLEKFIFNGYKFYRKRDSFVVLDFKQKRIKYDSMAGLYSGTLVEFDKKIIVGSDTVCCYRIPTAYVYEKYMILDVHTPIIVKLYINSHNEIDSFYYFNGLDFQCIYNPDSNFYQQTLITDK